MQVGTFSGVKSPGMVISSALGGTSKGNSSLTNDKIKDVFPTFLLGIHNEKQSWQTIWRLTYHRREEFGPPSDFGVPSWHTKPILFFHYLFFQLLSPSLFTKNDKIYQTARKSSRKIWQKSQKCQKCTFRYFFVKNSSKCIIHHLNNTKPS